MRGKSAISLRRLSVLFSLSAAFLLLLLAMRSIQAQEVTSQPAVGESDGQTGLITGTMAYFPAIFRAPPTVFLDPISRPEPVGEDEATWTLTWTPSSGSGITGYEIEESRDPAFDTVLATYTTTNQTYTVQRGHAFDNMYYYRVRTLGSWTASDWSNVRSVVGGYYDEMNDPSSGWDVRRQDTDDIDQEVRYENGWLIHEMDGRWDYMLSAPLRQAPTPPYRIDFSARLVGVDNLHVYGFVFGGDYEGGPCPVNDYSSCFNNYYRVLILWFGNPDILKVQIKRIDFHTEDDNGGSGPALLEFSDVTVNNPSLEWQEWSMEVFPDGNISLFVNGTYVTTVNDTQFIDQPYFGAFTATDEYAGLEAQYDWYRVRPLPSTRGAFDFIDEIIAPEDIEPEVPFVWPTGQD